jgi:hypothetical protein
MSRKFLLFAALLALFLVVLVGGSLSGVAYAYRDTFYPGVKVAGIDLSGKTEAEGKALVSERVKQYVEHPIKIVIPDISKPLADSPNQYEMEELSTTAGSLGLKFAGDEAVASAWSLGHGRNLIQWVQGVVPALFEGSKRSVAYSVDSNAINTYVNATVVPKIGAPVPAKIVINGTEVGVEQSKPGFEVDQDQLRKMLAKALDSAADKDPSYLQAPVTITESSVTKKSLQPVADKWNSLGDVKISLTMDGSTITPKRADLLKWFSAVQNEQGEVSLVADKDAIGQYLAKQSTIDSSKSLATVNEKVAALLAKEKPVSLAIAVTAKPPKETSATGFTLGKFEGKYVEVNLSNQKLFLINGNTLEKAYTVSTGAWATPTPLGTFTINGKIKRAWSGTYKLWMPYWQNFLNGEYGLHELPEWPNGYKEGQSHLGTPVSHGCIRLGVGAAKEVYDWTENGTPVYIHR